MKNPMSHVILSIRSCLVITAVIASVFLGIGFQISKAQTDMPEANPSDVFHESEQAARPERSNWETRREEGDTRNKDILSVLLDRSLTTSISGRLSTTEGFGISHGHMTLLEENGTSKSAVSDSFGYFRFAEIRTGQQVTIQSPDSNRYFCAPITLQLTGISIANFTCTQAHNEKAAKANPLPPPNCVEDGITDRIRQPLDSDQQALVPHAELPDCRSSGSR